LRFGNSFAHYVLRFKFYERPVAVWFEGTRKGRAKDAKKIEGGKFISFAAFAVFARNMIKPKGQTIQ
jgi:hypothetical protein